MDIDELRSRAKKTIVMTIDECSDISPSMIKNLAPMRNKMGIKIISFAMPNRTNDINDWFSKFTQYEG